MPGLAFTVSEVLREKVNLVSLFDFKHNYQYSIVNLKNCKKETVHKN